MNTSLTTLTDEEEKEFHRLARFYWREALRCKKAKAYLAGCIMLGSALETLIILMVNVYREEVEYTGKTPTKKGKPKPLIDWNLAEALRVAKATHWLPSALDLKDEWNSRKALIGDHAEIVRMIRNLAHPARYATDHFRSLVTKKYLERQFDIVLACRDWLAERNKESLIEHMKAEEIL